MPKARALMKVPATANRVMVPRLQNKERNCDQGVGAIQQDCRLAHGASSIKTAGPQEPLLSCGQYSLPLAAG